jgi:hypothetical protein
MPPETPATDQPTPPDSLKVRWLAPEKTSIFEGTYALLHCAVKGEGLYRGVFAVLMFPISHPDEFVSLRFTDREDRICEIGVIRSLNEFPPQAQELIRESLNRQYHEQTITKIHRVKCKYSLLFFEVETRRGREEFIMPWRYDRAEDYSARGKLLLDVFDNRYVVPDVAALPSVERRRFLSYVYW